MYKRQCLSIPGIRGYVPRKCDITINYTNRHGEIKSEQYDDFIARIFLHEYDHLKVGFIIPDSAKEKPHEAEVVALGTGKKDEDGKAIPFQVKKGDKVLISKYGGTEVKLDDVEYKLVREDDILGVIG